MNVHEALVRSCDVFFYQVGQRLGVDTIAEYAHRFGLGAPTGITLEHESGVLTRLTATFWVRPGKQRGLEFHGSDASLWMPTWGESDSRLLQTTNGEDYEAVPLLRPAYAGLDWSVALVDLAEAIRDDRPHRMGAEHAAHVVDVLNAADRSRRDGGAVEVDSTFDAPPPLDWAR